MRPAGNLSNLHSNIAEFGQPAGLYLRPAGYRQNSSLHPQLCKGDGFYASFPGSSVIPFHMSSLHFFKQIARHTFHTVLWAPCTSRFTFDPTLLSAIIQKTMQPCCVGWHSVSRTPFLPRTSPRSTAKMPFTMSIQQRTTVFVPMLYNVGTFGVRFSPESAQK